MKKLIIITSMGLMLLSGTAFAQGTAPVRDKPTDRVSDFRVPRILHDNPEIQECIAAFRAATSAFKTALSGMRAELEGATEEQAAAIKLRVRTLHQTQRDAQIALRKKVKQAARDFRLNHATTDSAG
ncbi:MAG: hypothetical protein O3C43_17630 [Verrucomicrobia bacterium]|nr:hypothetical protein [Verrucomicrobiota bacterium]MDA1068313.1 hypothetical protein [Verrucomicrobiota bacterium]